MAMENQRFMDDVPNYEDPILGYLRDFPAMLDEDERAMPWCGFFDRGFLEGVKTSQ